MKYQSALVPKLIYVFRINDRAHKGCLKVGEATVEGDTPIFSLSPNCSALNKSAKKRINQYTQTAGIAYELLHTELTIYTSGKEVRSFNDKEVHEVLKRSGIKQKCFNPEAKADEWFIADLETVKNAIAAVRAGKKSLHSSEIFQDRSPIIFRPEQQDAIQKTIRQFKKNNVMLWDAKMRFGKTLSALQVVKKMDLARTLILTHRPVVNAGWFEDFQKIFYDSPRFSYGSKAKGETISSLENQFRKRGSHYVYFASMQDLRGSERTGGKFDKNDEIFDTRWDLIIVDEAHEGTQTSLGQNVLNELTRKDTKVLQLSGTPFNLLDNYNEDEIYTWDYVMEQKAKAEWDKLHFGDPNPYAELPRLNIFTFDLGDKFSEFKDSELAFNFHEFFRVDEAGEFVHRKSVKAFLDLICQPDNNTNYPFSTQEYRDNFRHSFWRIPGVKEGKALSAMLQSHRVFGQFRIVNVAGEGDDDEKNEEALRMVKAAIAQNDYTITLSCGRLTTGVTVPEWTAVFMLAGSYSTSASSYMQTIFRAQSPAVINGKRKEECFVFDFAPDRTLKVLAQTAKISAKAGKTSGTDRQQMGEFLNFCPVIACNGTKMTEYNVDHMLEQLKKVYVERVVRNGFEDGYLYNNDMLMKLDENALDEFDGLKEIIGATKAMPKTGDIDINNQGFTDEEYEKVEEAEKRSRQKKELTKAQQKLLEEKKKRKKNRDTAISILRGISIRMPLMIYGAELKDESQEITINNFTALIDPDSWDEFMPRGVTKQLFNSFRKYYDPDIFRAAGKRIRMLAKAADDMTIEDRIERITGIFSTFRNPDKETVLTPWRVVNMHLSDCLGGYCFYDENFESPLPKPRLVKQGKTTNAVFNSDSRILEINSKSGLYPLYVAYSIYRARLKEELIKPTLESVQKIWDQVLAENLFIICKTPMARSITKRTLCGFRKGRVNAHYFEDLTNMLKNKQQQFIDRITRESFWGLKGHSKMNFDAIVGNPPYQEMGGGFGVASLPLYDKFILAGKKLSPKYLSMIIPAKWFAGGRYLDEFRDEMLRDKQLKIIFDYENGRWIFDSVDIPGGVCYFLWENEFTGDCQINNILADGTIVSEERALDEFKTFIRSNQAVEIVRKVLSQTENFLSNKISFSKPFGLRTFYPPQKKGIPCWFIQKTGLMYAKANDVQDPYGYLKKWKLLIPPAPIAGQTDFSKPVGFYYDGNVRISKPGECCTESWLVAGAFDTKEETLSFKSYLFTKIVRFLLLQAVVSQHVTRKNFCFVPDLQHYSGRYSDKQLCKKWKITEDEWKYIDSRISSTENVID